MLCLENILLVRHDGLEGSLSPIIDPRKKPEYDPSRFSSVPSKSNDEAFDDLAGDGGAGRPPQGGAGFPMDDYEKEKADIRRYFSRGAISFALKTQQDELHAAMGVRLLNSLGKLLDNYEIHIPADYRLELLKRAGRFCEEANIFERLAQGKIQMFKYREQLEGGFIFRATPSEPEKVFSRGFSREDLENVIYPTTRHHIYKFKRRSGDSYISASTSAEILEKLHFASREEDGFGRTPESNEVEPHYLFIINPRALTGIDIVESQETYEIPPPEGKESRPFRQKEVVTANYIDPRDIMGVYKVKTSWITAENGKKKVKVGLVEYMQNEKYIFSGWEMNSGVLQ
ncbi:MAG: hypothetical protein WCW64_00725 [Phycisphaerae bacterium]|jgi:hypothetical protein